MESYPQLVPLIILIPAIGAFINLFLGARLTERAVAIIGTGAAILSFVVALLLYSYLSGGGAPVVVDPPFFDGWLRVANIDISWQMRVDTLSVTMMLLVTGVGSLIHIYSAGYMHGDERFHRFFAYLNMFFAFMLTLVAGNNFLMLFVGWEGVGLCSFLLIGFWFDKAKGVGWRNSLAARKAFIVNRVGDFGLMTAIFLTFWTFGTLDYYRPGEIANPEYGAHSEGAADEAHAEGAAVVDEAHAEGAAVVDEAHAEGAAEEGHSEGAAVVDEAHAEEGAVAEGEDGHGGVAEPVYTNNDHIATSDLGVFGQAERMLEAQHEVDFGPFTLPIETVLVLITFFMLIGAAGKSAQIPLFVWLPDAMAGPTPVSALIHAATMVTAGVYMMVRSNVFFYEADLTSLIVTLVGVTTALVGGFVALGQWDIKRVLAYSTVSQLGFMVAAVGIGAYSAAMFHLVTHAFFKALLFLGSGSVIHGMEHGHHEIAHGHGHADHHDEHHDAPDHAEADSDDAFDPQDMRNMGGLRHKMPITYWTYLIGTLALAGIFPLAGFWSKDEILADSWLAGLFENDLGGYIALGGLLIAAGFTAFYMWRQVTMVFHGKARHDAADHAHESPPAMTIPLIVLAILSIFGGFINVPSNVLGLDGIFGAHRFTDWLEQTVVHAHAADFQLLIALAALGLAIAAIFLASRIYGNNKAVVNQRDPLQENYATAPIFNLSNARLYWDQIYGALIEQPFNRMSKFLADTLDWRFWHDYVHETVIAKGFNAIGQLLSKPFDLGIIDGTVNGIGVLVRRLSGGARRIQTGYVRTYAITLLLGVVVVIIVLLLPLINSGR
ncbi:MAG: proton-conducting transporter membrane subunit [Chloroflexota bacterium]|nr:proton-conducting transporter membrane subunit [Chloroflexota bacterium]